jgi:signal transduction histidine kinase
MRLQRWLGVGAWLAAGASVLLDLGAHPERLSSPRWAAWLVLYALFGASYWSASSLAKHDGSRALCRGLVAAQTVAVLGLAFLAPRGLLGALLVIVAAQLARVVRREVAWSWVVAQTLAVGALFGLTMSATGAWTLATAFAALQAFTLYTWDIAAQEQQSARELARLNAELMDAQGLLAERSRSAERLRIARDLHDVAGHHLTALSLALEAVRHSPPEQALELLARAQALTRQLLQDVRRVVSALRDSEGADLERALATVGAGISRPHVHVTAPGTLRIGDPGRARAALHCVQEIVTNTIKHSDADNLWLEFTPSPEGITIRAHDDGRGASRISPGLGLTGMKERLESVGGRVAFASAVGRGFEVEAWIPLSGNAR